MKTLSKRRSFRIALVLGLSLLISTSAFAQTGDGGLIGYVRDASGAVLPGITVTATSPGMIAERQVFSDENGYFRIINLPVGIYALTGELPGFSTFRQEGINVRAGSTFTVNVVMQVGAVTETITVTSESPMIDTISAESQVLVDGEFQRSVPVQARRNWSDILELTPGIMSRPFDDNSGRMVYYGRGAHHFTHVIKMDGANASSYYDAQPTFINMSTDSIGDVELKSGGADASTEMGVGLNVNIVTPNGGNEFHGQVTATMQGNGDGWNDGQSQVAAVASRLGGSGGSPTIQQVFQYDGNFGGPIVRDRLWFFGNFRHNRLENGISRSSPEIEQLKAFGLTEIFNNRTQATQWFAKATAQLNDTHSFLFSLSDDTVNFGQNREYNVDQIRFASTGGKMYTFKLDSIWSSAFSSQLLFSYNNKSGNNQSGTYDRLDEQGLSGPLIEVHRDASLSGGVLSGSGRIVDMGNSTSRFFQPASRMEFKADFAYFKQGGGGSHEFKWGLYTSPRNRFDVTREYSNGGFTNEDHRLVDPDDLTSGTIPFSRSFEVQQNITEFASRESDLGLYIQDSWQPTQRLTLNLGVRVDFVNRKDEIFNITRQDSTEWQPNFGLSWMIGSSGNDVFRLSVKRQHQAMTGRDNVTRYIGAAGSASFTLYDNDGDGVFETRRDSPATDNSVAAKRFDPDLHQPFTDEFILGFRHQFPGQFSIDISAIQKQVKHIFGEVDINGIYPAGPGLPFIGFGKVGNLTSELGDVERGVVRRMTNNTWSRMNLQAVDFVVTKNMSNNYMILATFSKQRHWEGGSWNPTSYSKFIQPEAFENHNSLQDTRGNNDDQTPTGGSTIWGKYSMSLAGTYNAPAGIVVSSSYTQHDGAWSGTVRRRASSAERAVFGPSSFTSPNGLRFSNPLRTSTRYFTDAVPIDAVLPEVEQNIAATRSHQLNAPAVQNLSIKIGRDFNFGDTQKLQVALNILNAFNGSRHYQFARNGSRTESPSNFSRFRNLQPPRSYQIVLQYKF